MAPLGGVVGNGRARALELAAAVTGESGFEGYGP